MEETTIKTENSMSDNQYEKKEFHCDQCDMVYAHKGSLVTHIKDSHNPPTIKFSCVCEYERHMNKNAEEIKSTCELCKHKSAVLLMENIKYTCQMCNYRTSREYDLKLHMNIHTRDKKFKCDACDFVTCHKRSLAGHIKNRHSQDNKKFACRFCGLVTLHKNSLVSHMKTMHSEGECRKFACEICGFKTSNRSNLKIHMNIHTRDKRFNCQLCEFVALRRNSLVNHVKNMHSHNESKKFACEFCDYKTDIPQGIKRHKDKHSAEKKYKCDFCDFVSAHHSSLLKHKKNVHIPEESKKYVCEICEYKTNELCILKRHKSRHKNEQKVDYHSLDFGRINEAQTVNGANFSEKIQTVIKTEEDIIEIGPIQLLHTVKEEISEVTEKSAPDMNYS